MLLSTRLLSTALLFLFVAACVGPSEEVKLFDRSIFAYEKALRWQDYDFVLSIHKSEHATLTPEKRKALKQYRVTGYNVVYSKMENDQRHATQVIEIKYYNEAYNVVRELTIQNEWEFNVAEQRWYLTNPLPDFK